MRISRKENQESEGALATAFHSSYFSSVVAKKKGFSSFSPVRERKNFLPSSLPRFISIFLRAFCVQFHPLASLPPFHILFLFPGLFLRHSRSRRARSSPLLTRSLILLLVFPAQFYPHLYTRTPVYTVCLPLRSFALLIHFTTVVSSLSPASLSPSFFLSLGRFIASSTTLHSLHPLSQPFPLSPRTLVPFAPFPLLPHLPKTLFSRGPFASTVIRHPFLSFSPLAPMTGRDILPFSLVLSYIFVLVLFISLFLPFLATFSLPLYIHLSIFSFYSLPAALSFSACFSSPCYASFFLFARCLLRFSRVSDAIACSPLLGLFPFVATVLETTA